MQKLLNFSGLELADFLLDLLLGQAIYFEIADIAEMILRMVPPDQQVLYVLVVTFEQLRNIVHKSVII